MNTAKPMNYFTAVFLMLSAVLSFQQSVSAQLPTADLRRISPFSAIAGKTVDMTIVGTNLDQTTELRFTHPGIIAKPVLLPTDDLFPQARIQNTRFKVTVSPEVPRESTKPAPFLTLDYPQRDRLSWQLPTAGKFRKQGLMLPEKQRCLRTSIL